MLVGIRVVSLAKARPMTKGGSLPRERKKEEVSFLELFLGVPCVLGAKLPNSAPKLTSDFGLPTSDL
jgi:hypothetical protein